MKIPFLVEDIQVRAPLDPGPECCGKPIRKMNSRIVVYLEFEDDSVARGTGLKTKESMIRKIVQKDIRPLELIDFEWYELNRFAYNFEA